MLEEIPCPVCGAAHPGLYIDGDDEPIAVESVGSSRAKLSHGRILLCGSCGLAYRSLRPESDQLARLYQAADDQTYEAEMRNRRRTAERHKRIAGKHCPARGTLIDVGCASGAFLCIMADSGWRVFGVEPSISQYARAVGALNGRGHIQNCVLQEAELPEHVDLVTMWDVLEHVPEPVQFLELAASFLKPGGYVIVNVPRIDSLAARLLGARWPVLLAEHLCYFTAASLRECGRRAGLDLLETGQRPVSFSLDYLFFRGAQHGIPAASVIRRVLTKARVSSLSFPFWLGEVYAVYKKPESPGPSLPLSRH